MRELTLGKIYKNGIQYSGTTDAATNINYDNSKGAIRAGNVQGAIDEIMETTSQSRTLTQAEYDALPDTKYTDGIEYFITDAEPLDASTIAYDNTASKMTATNVQAGIDELNSSLQAKLTNENSETFNFGVLNGVRGFFTNPSRADDCFIPFNSIKKVNMDSLGNKELFLGFKANFVFIFWESKPTICAFYLRNKSSNTVYFIENNNMNARTIGGSNCPINSITDNSIVLHAWASDQLTEWSILAN